MAEFACWFEVQARLCRYCTIPEPLIELLGIRTQVGHLLRRLGVDRVDGRAPYRLGNLALCCFACNKVKSNTFASAEMALLGAAVGNVWRDRLAEQGVDWAPGQVTWGSLDPGLAHRARRR